MNLRQLAAWILVVAFTMQQSTIAAKTAYPGSSQPAPRNNQTVESERREFRRQHFDHARQALLDKGVPFDPEDLLDDDWPKKLKYTLATMPAMHDVRYETAPLKGAYIADTLYLPEKVELADHTVLLVRNLVFEGREPVIRGSFDFHFYPTEPTAVLGTTLAEALRK